MSKRENLKRKVRLMSINSEWLLVIHEQGNDTSIVYSFDESSPEKPLHMTATYFINKTFSKKTQVFKPLRPNSTDLQAINSIIQKTLGVIAEKTELTREFKRDNSIYLVTIKEEHGRTSKKRK